MFCSVSSMKTDPVISVLRFIFAFGSQKLICSQRCFLRRISSSRRCYYSVNIDRKESFGILFDIDGVIARGYVPLPVAVEAFKVINDAHINIPTAFVTNAVTLNDYKAGQLTEWLGVKVHGSQMVMAPGPLRVLSQLHNQFCLVIGQGPVREVAAEMGFQNVCCIEDIAEAFPLLDVADHDKRDQMSQATADVTCKDFPKLDAIVLFGEPKHWETPLQLLIDLLLTNGKPSHTNRRHLKQTVPVVACNLDLQYMHRASYPRFGHGAFLLCLESLFKKLTGQELQYDYVVGKPSELTFRYAEHLLSTQASQMGIKPLRRLYMIGDNPEVDIYGSNLYQRFISHRSPNIPSSRAMPAYAKLLPQTVDRISGILVKTGVYHPKESAQTSNSIWNPCPSHRDFVIDRDLMVPDSIQDTVLDAIKWIFHKEGIS